MTFRTKFVISFLILSLTTLLLGNHAVAQEDGHLSIRYSPTLGMNVGLEVRVDGRLLGGISRGHVLSRPLSPGRHRLVVRPNGRLFDEYDMILHVQPGQTYSYVAKFPGRRNIVLVPVGEPR